MRMWGGRVEGMEKWSWRVYRSSKLPVKNEDVGIRDERDPMLLVPCDQYNVRCRISSFTLECSNLNNMLPNLEPSLSVLEPLYFGAAALYTHVQKCSENVIVCTYWGIVF